MGRVDAWEVSDVLFLGCGLSNVSEKCVLMFVNYLTNNLGRTYLAMLFSRRDGSLRWVYDIVDMSKPKFWLE